LEEYELEIELHPLDSLLSEDVRSKFGDSPRRQQGSQLVPVNAKFRNLDLSLDDLVAKPPMSATDRHMYPNDSDRLRRIVIEALARIHARNDLALQLELLNAQPGVEFICSERDSDANDDNLVDTHWVLRIRKDQIGVTWIADLILTPDCPLFRGSVSLNQLHQLSENETGEQSLSLPDVCARVNQESFSAPHELVVRLLEQLPGSEGFPMTA
jgi:hypothetical protein